MKMHNLDPLILEQILANIEIKESTREFREIVQKILDDYYKQKQEETKNE